MKRISAAAVTAAVAMALLTGCGESDECDDEARGALGISTMSLAGGRSGGSSGGGSKGGSGTSKGSGKSGTSKGSKGSSGGGSHHTRVDDDWIEACDD